MRFFPRHSYVPCWLEVRTQVPHCVYFFGPFQSSREAHDHQDGYIADLVEEGAQGIRVALQRKEPRILTLAEDMPTFR